MESDPLEAAVQSALHYATVRGIISRPDHPAGLHSARLAPRLPMPETEWKPLQGYAQEVDELLARETLGVTRDAAILIKRTLQLRAPIDLESLSERVGIANKPSLKGLKEELPLLPASRSNWKRPAVPPKDWKDICHGCKSTNLFEIPKVTFLTEEKLGMTQDVMRCLKKASKPDPDAVSRADAEGIQGWKGRSDLKMSPPLSPVLRELSPSYFIIPRPAKLHAQQLLRELEESMEREDQLSVPSSTEEHFSHFFGGNKTVPDIPVYNYRHPDEYRLTSPLIPLEDDSKELYKINHKAHKQIPTPPNSSQPAGDTFSSTSFAQYGRDFQRELGEEQLLENDSSLRVDVPHVPMVLSGPVWEVSRFQPGFLKANMGLAARKYKGEKTLGRYTLRWFPFKLEDREGPVESGIEGDFDMGLVIDARKGRLAEKELHEMVDGLILNESEEEELFPLPARAPNHTVVEMQVPEISQPLPKPQPQLPPQLPQPRKIAEPQPPVISTDFKKLIAQRKRKAPASFDESAEANRGKDRFSAFSSFLQTRGKEAPKEKRPRPAVPLFTAPESEPSSDAATSPFLGPKPVEYIPAAPLSFTPTVIVPAENTPTLATLSRLLSNIIPTPIVMARDFLYPASTPDLILSSSHALIFSHERRLTQTSLLPGDKPLPGRESNPLRQRISDLYFSQAYEGIIILLETDAHSSSQQLSSFRGWARDKFAGNVLVATTRTEELVVGLAEVLGRYCSALEGQYVYADESFEERQLVAEGMNPYKAAVRCNESFLNEEMFED